jgi:hypothetical protein
MPNVSLNTIGRSSSRGLTNLADVDNHLRTTLDSLILQINLAFQDVGDLAEVDKVYTDINDLDKNEEEVPKYELIGAIKFKKLTHSTNTVSEGIAYPFDPNLKQYPVEGEYVTIRYVFGMYFYTQRINIMNNPNNASFPDLASKYTRIGNHQISNKTLATADSGMPENVTNHTENMFLGDYFKPNFNYKKLAPNEGDVILEGRFGNSIRFSSNIKQEKEDSPNIKLRTGQLQDATKFGQEELVDRVETSLREVPVVEDINSDGSSIWMTTDEVVPLIPATLEDANIYPNHDGKVIQGNTPNGGLGGKQIVLNSGRLIFNSKENGILGFSNGPIDFSTLNTFGVAAKQSLNLYSPTVVIGRAGKHGKTKNINLKSSNVTVRADSGKALTRAKKIFLVGPVEGEDVRRAKKTQIVEQNGVPFPGRDIQISPAVKGKELRELLKTMLDIMKLTSQSVQTLAAAVGTGLPAAIGGPPAVAVQTQQAAQVAGRITENILKDITARIDELPKILSRVVELE